MNETRVELKALEQAAQRMFEEADGDGDGMVTLAEINAIVEHAQEEAIAERFGTIDGDGNAVIDRKEFSAWQRQLGAASGNPAVSVAFEPLPDAVSPPPGRNGEDVVLAMLLKPINATNLVEANRNYDAGMSFDEFLGFEREAFDEADSDRDGTLSSREIRELIERRRGPADHSRETPSGEDLRMPPPRAAPTRAL